MRACVCVCVCVCVQLMRVLRPEVCGRDHGLVSTALELWAPICELFQAAVGPFQISQHEIDDWSVECVPHISISFNYF